MHDNLWTVLLTILYIMKYTYNISFDGFMNYLQISITQNHLINIFFSLRMLWNTICMTCSHIWTVSIFCENLNVNLTSVRYR